LRNFEQDVLRFMDVTSVPFTFNQGENDLRMTKVQQKISGCFRSKAGARIFRSVRSNLSSCRKHGLSVTDALSLLFEGKPQLHGRRPGVAWVAVSECAEQLRLDEVNPV